MLDFEKYERGFLKNFYAGEFPGVILFFHASGRFSRCTPGGVHNAQKNSIIFVQYYDLFFSVLFVIIINVEGEKNQQQYTIFYFERKKHYEHYYINFC